MRLVKFTADEAQYQLNATELYLLQAILQKFPFAAPGAGEISRTGHGQDVHSAERENLLRQSLAEHRRELTVSARSLLGGGRVQAGEKGHLLTLTASERETLLQILNDIRIGCWHALGEPEELDSKETEVTEEEFAWRNLMHLSGYFEHALLINEEDGGEPGEGGVQPE